MLYYQLFHGIITVTANFIGSPELLFFNDYTIYYVTGFKYFKSNKYLVMIYWAIDGYLILNELTIVTLKLVIRDLVIRKNIKFTFNYLLISIFASSLTTMTFCLITMVIFFDIVDVNTINIKNHTLEGDELINPKYENFIIIPMKLFERILISCSAIIFLTLNYTTVVVLMRKYFIFLKNQGNIISVKTRNIACNITKAQILECTVPCILYIIPVIIIGVSFITEQIKEIKNVGTLTLRILIIGPFCNSLISLFVNRKNRENLKKIIISMFCCRHLMKSTVSPENRFIQRSVKASRIPVTETKFDSRFALF